MANKAMEPEVESYVCWLCGHVEPAKPDVASMREQQCPRCRLGSAFVPRPARIKHTPRD